MSGESPYYTLDVQSYDKYWGRIDWNSSDAIYSPSNMVWPWLYQP